MEQFIGQNPNDTSSKSPNDKRRAAANKRWYITIGTALIMIFFLWIWKSKEMSNAEKKAATDIKILQKQATDQIVETHKAHLLLLAKPYVWAIRSEMMRGDVNQLNLYSIEMVKENNFQRIAVANDKGIVISSTNKKDEGQSFSNIGDEKALSSDATAVKNINDSILIMTSPIMGFNNRIGTLFIKYAIQKPVFK